MLFSFIFVSLSWIRAISQDEGQGPRLNIMDSEDYRQRCAAIYTYDMERLTSFGFENDNCTHDRQECYSS